MDIEVGAASTLRRTVTHEDTAAAVGSGSLPVLATPRLLAWCEAATCEVVDRSVPPGRTSVGTRVQLEHVAASPVGATVEVTATVVYADGRLLRFEVVAEQTAPDGAADGTGDGSAGGSRDEAGGPVTVVSHGEVTRVVVDRERFLSRL